jgi:hypothetical protein
MKLITSVYRIDYISMVLEILVFFFLRLPYTFRVNVFVETLTNLDIYYFKLIIGH